MQLINGDCLEEMKQIPSGSVDLILTDPPYVISKASGFAQGKLVVGGIHSEIEGRGVFEPLS